MLEMDFTEYSIEKWSLTTKFMFSVGVMLGLETLSRIIPFIFNTLGSKLIPVKGKHLDTLSFDDHLYITINKLLTVMFTYHLIWVCQSSSSIKWKLEEASIYNTLGSLIAFYIFYDFFYTNFHRVLHFRAFYGYVHKHHHKQRAPSRGNMDAINVHPFEFLVGEYIHLLTIYCIPCHIYAVAIFILLGGFLASLNHTRFDISIPGLYSVKVHDVHHRLVESNYGQYTMLWDLILGSYRSYDGYTA